jgi:hypothetical protein
MLREQGELAARGMSAGFAGGTIGATGEFGGASMTLPQMGGTGAHAGMGGDGAPGVGDSEDVGGFALGFASDHARPVTGTDAPQGKARGGGDGGAAGAAGSGGLGGSGGAEGSGARFATSGFDVTDRDRAYMVFKGGPGKAKAKAMQTDKDALRALKAKAKEVSAKVNAAKGEIDALETQIEEKKSARLAAKSPGEREEMEDVVDEEEFLLMKSEREAKRAYRSAYEALRETRSEIEAAAARADQAKAALIADFDKWHADVLADELSPRAPADDDDDDKLDDQEQFDKMEIDRVVSQDPDAVAYFQAQKTRRANKTQNRTSLRQMHKNKRSN